MWHRQWTYAAPSIENQLQAFQSVDCREGQLLQASKCTAAILQKKWLECCFDLSTSGAHKGLGLRKVLKKVLKKALKKILLTQKRTQKSKCTFLSTQKSTQKFNFSECWVQKFTQKRSPKEILLKKVIYCPKLYSKKWTVFIPTYKYRWWHYPLVG